MNFIQRIAFKLGLKRLEKAMPGAGKFLDGKKSVITALGVVVVGIVHLATGRDMSAIVYGVFSAMGWSAELTSTLTQVATAAVPLLWAMWSSAHGLVKLWKQRQAGASIAETGSPSAQVKLAIAEGVIPPVPIKPPEVAVPLTPAKLEKVIEAQAVIEEVAKKA